MFTINGPVNKNAKLLMPLGPGYVPIVITSPEDELLASRKTAWLGHTLFIAASVYDISGPDVVKMLNYITVNRDYNTLKIGASRHAILCNEKGQMLADGVILRKDKNTYRTYCLAPVISYYTDCLGMDVQGHLVLDEFFLQIDGPKSLEIMEKACREDLHDLKFAQNKNVCIAGVTVNIHRLGMSGCLAYEMHGDASQVENVYGAIMEAGQEMGIRQLGFTQYCRNHTQAGYPNQWIHYLYPWHCGDHAMSEYIHNAPVQGKPICYPIAGSASDNEENAYVTPFDVKWDYLINYDHEFIGKKALLDLKKDPPRTVVTLEWNPQDVGAAYATQISGTDVEPVDDINNDGDCGEKTFVISKVMAEGKMIGVTSGRSRDYYHRRMLSLAFLDKEYAVEGKELVIIWGTNPKNTIEIRATVAPFPYYNEEMRNETFDVEKIPHPVF